MQKKLTAKARGDLASVLRAVAKGNAVELVREKKAVAVVLPKADYDALVAQAPPPVAVNRPRRTRRRDEFEGMSYPQICEEIKRGMTKKEVAAMSKQFERNLKIARETIRGTVGDLSTEEDPFEGLTPMQIAAELKRGMTRKEIVRMSETFERHLEDARRSFGKLG